MYFELHNGIEYICLFDINNWIGSAPDVYHMRRQTEIFQLSSVKLRLYVNTYE